MVLEEFRKLPVEPVSVPVLVTYIFTLGVKHPEGTTKVPESISDVELLENVEQIVEPVEDDSMWGKLESSTFPAVHARSQLSPLFVVPAEPLTVP